MSALERDFNNFEMHDDVRLLASGLIPEIASGLGVELPETLTPDALQTVMNEVGRNKVLRGNEEITALSRDQMVDMVERSGLQRSMNRSLVYPNVQVGSETTDAIVIMGGVANWQDRAAAVLMDKRYDLPVYAIAGPRLMDSGTEVNNAGINQFAESKQFPYYPNEIAYAAEVVLPRLVEAGIRVEKPFFYNSDNGDELFARFFAKHPELLGQRLALVRNANAGVVMGFQMREAARSLRSDFDTDPDNPQTLIETDSFPLATTDEQDKDSAHYQKAATALRQVVLTAKKLFESQQ